MSTTLPAGDRRPPALRRTGKALPGDARAHNRSLLLQCLFRGGPYSRADLARLTGLTRVTVSDLVTDLLADGLVVELGPRTETRVGKPATLIALHTDAAHLVTLDLSRDQAMTGALLGLDGRVLHRLERQRAGTTGEAAVALVVDLARALVDAATRPVLGVGIGTPGDDDPDGVVLDAPNMGWAGVRLADRVAAQLSLPVHAANDANTAALAEHTFGDADDGGSLVLTVGQGVGAGLLLDGALVQGNRFAAGEIGHVVVDEDGVPCVCGRRGCLETVLAVPPLRRALAEAAAEAGADGGADGGDADGDAAEARERVLARAGRLLGVALAPVVGTLDLTHVVLNGPPDLLGGPLLDAAVDTVRRRTRPAVGEHLVVRLSDLHDDAVLLGAGVLVLSGQLGVA